MNNIFTDRDGINLCELVYQNIKRFEGLPLFTSFFNNDGGVKADIKRDFRNFAKNLETYPKYYEPTFKKYELIYTHDRNSESGYYGAAFYDEGSSTLIIANRGTEPNKNDGIDLLTDANIGLGKADQQFVDANECYHASLISAKNNEKVIDNIYVTGHSLGGGLASVQFVTYYHPEGKLKGGITFEAPGMERVYENAQKYQFIDKDSLRELSVHRALPIEFYRSRDVSDFAQMIHGNYDNLKSKSRELLVAYGTTLDWVYNVSVHIGKKLNPLIDGGHFIGHTVLGTAIDHGVSTDVFHPVSTYKIYKLKDDDSIDCGHLEVERFLKMVIPELLILKLNNDEIVKFLKQMNKGKFISEGAIHDVLMDRFTNSSYPNHEIGRVNEASYDKRFKEYAESLNANKSVINTIYKYSVLFGFLKSGIDDISLTQSAEKLLNDDLSATDNAAQKEYDEAYRKKIMIMEFEAFNNIFDLESIRLTEILKKSGSFITERNYLAYEHLLELSTGFNHSYTIKEEMLCREYYDEYKELCKNITDVNRRIEKLDNAFFMIDSQLNNGMFDI